MSRFAQPLAERGHRIVGDAELQTSTTIRTVQPGGEVVTDGPYAEVIEGMGGFYLVEAPDLDVLVELLGVLPAYAGPITVQAASSTLRARTGAEHARALRPEDTRWERIVTLYDTLLAVAPSPGARLARAVAVAEAHGPAAGIAALEGVEITASHRVPAV